MTFQDYDTQLGQSLSFYGFTYNPLTKSQRKILWYDGISLDAAYGIACDIASGFSFIDALDANN